MSETEQVIAEVDGLVDEGLFVSNLDKAIKSLRDLVRTSSGAVQLGAYVVESVMADLANSWDTGPLSGEVYASINRELAPFIKNCLSALASGETDPASVLSASEELVGRFVQLQIDGGFKK